MIIDRSKIGKPSKPVKNGESNRCMAGFGDHKPPRDYVNITDMIRSLQRTEGLVDCFRRRVSDCDQPECAWRQYCLNKTDELFPRK